MKTVFKLISIQLLLISCILIDKPESSPTVITLEASEVKLNSFVMTGEVSDEGFSAANERGFVWSQTNPNPSVSDNKVVVGYGKGQYSHLFEKLTVNTKYFIKAFATNNKGTSYGEVKSIITADYLLATVSTDLPKNITYTSAELGGNVLEDGGIAVTEKGLCLAINKTPTIDDIKITNAKGVGPFANIVVKLQEGSNYVVKAYAINGKGISYGNEQKFTTNAFKVPTVTTNNAQNIYATFATLYGNVSDNGGTDIIEKGFCLSKNSNPNITDLKVKASNLETGDYAILTTALDPMSKYFVKAYAQNLKGIAYGNEITFSTPEGNIPTVGTNDIQEITQTSVRAGVEIASNGGIDISEYGVCISKNRNPTIYDRKIILGTTNSLGKMDNISGLTSSTTYYLRGYAINKIGIAYGPERIFTTLNPFQINLRNGLSAFYTFNGNAFDRINNYNGKIFGAIPDMDRFGNLNQAFRFNGSSDYIIVNQFNTSSTSISISFWVYDIGQGKTSNSVNPRFISAESGGGIAVINNIVNEPQGLTFVCNRGGATYFSNNQIAKNSWQHIVVTFDGNQCLFYINGILVKKEIASNPLPQNGGDLYIGKSGVKFEAIEDFFAGKLDDIGIWNRVLNPDEINYLFKNNYQP